MWQRAFHVDYVPIVQEYFLNNTPALKGCLCCWGQCDLQLAPLSNYTCNTLQCHNWYLLSTFKALLDLIQYHILCGRLWINPCGYHACVLEYLGFVFDDHWHPCVGSGLEVLDIHWDKSPWSRSKAPEGLYWSDLCGLPRLSHSISSSLGKSFWHIKFSDRDKTWQVNHFPTQI